MGTYLSTPVTEKCEESGESLDCPDVPCAWGVVDMQGWRKTMEDAHVAVTDISLPSSSSSLPQDDRGKTTSDAKVFGVFDGHGGGEVARFCGLYLVSVLTQQETWKNGELTKMKAEGVKHMAGIEAGETDVGIALRCTFHALDRMIADIDRRGELSILRNTKPQTGERREALSIPEPLPLAGEPPQAEPGIVSLAESISDEGSSEKPPPVPSDSETSGEVPVAQEAREMTEGVAADDDSVEAVGKEEAAEQDRDMMDENDEQDATKEDDAILEVDASQPTKVTTMFQKILSLGAQGGQVILNVGADGDSDAKLTPDANAPPAAALKTGPSTSQPSIVQNGRMICNLPDHAIHAGATATVAVLTGRILTVANAGDTRAVMCRAGGKTLPLSFDHKPQSEVEMNRITKAGGFVNHFGRVNGNLNLSRSIGDLKYKQVPGITPPEQIISAEPDIIQVFLEPDDEFIIIGCDGIWDCLTNENAVQYVRERIDVKSPADIGKEMLDEIISEDPRVTQGIGGDNMTIMIIDLQPSTRKYRSAGPADDSAAAAESSPETNTEAKGKAEAKSE